MFNWLLEFLLLFYASLHALMAVGSLGIAVYAFRVYMGGYKLLHREQAFALCLFGAIIAMGPVMIILVGGFFVVRDWFREVREQVQFYDSLNAKTTA